MVALAEAARIVGEGGMIDPVEQDSSDEIGQLTGQFNQMTASLHEQKITIDRQAF